MIEREERGDVRILRMARGKGNSLSLDFMEALLAELDAAESSSARALVLTGQEKVFCAGVDLFLVLEKGRPYLDAFLPTLDRLFLRLLTFPKPTVAAINGGRQAYLQRVCKKLLGIHLFHRCRY